MDKHTWHIEEQPTNFRKVFVIWEDTKYIASVDAIVSVEENLTNARLIAAAPDLLAALIGLLAKCQERRFHPLALLEAESAIAKATS